MALPALAINVQGLGTVTADNLNTFLQWCPTAPVLRTFVGVSNMIVALEGIATINDGNAGLFYWNPTGTTADDNLNFITPSAAPASGGQWVRLTFSAAGITLAGDVTGPAGANLIAAGAVDTDEIANASVTGAKIANGTITAANIVSATITGTQIANSTIINGLLANMPDQTVKGNVSGAPAAPTDVSITTLLGSGFTQSLATNGWIKFPNGLIVEWGDLGAQNVGASGTATFPLAFPHACFNTVIKAVTTAGNSADMHLTAAPTLTGFTWSLFGNANTLNNFWIAIGN